MKQKSLISDAEFARAWVGSRRKSKKKGRLAIKAELIQKGIDRDIIEKVLQDYDLNENEESLALEAIDKKLRSWGNLNDLSFKKKAYDFLMRRGFEYQIVVSVVAKVLKKA